MMPAADSTSADETTTFPAFSTLRPLLNRVIVKKAMKITTESGIIFYQRGVSREEANYGTVIAISEFAKDDFKKSQDEWCGMYKVGSIVLLDNEAGHRV